MNTHIASWVKFAGQLLIGREHTSLVACPSIRDRDIQQDDAAKFFTMIDWRIWAMLTGARAFGRHNVATDNIRLSCANSLENIETAIARMDEWLSKVSQQ